jgi:hypothetical protein
MRLGKNFIKQKLCGRSVLVGADHIIVPIIWIWKDLSPMCFWSHGQSFPGKVSKMKVVEHLPIEKWVRFWPLHLPIFQIQKLTPV